MATDTLTLLRSGKLAGAKRLDLSQGLTEFPREIFDLADTLEVLNLSQNRLTELPEDLNRLSKLRILFCSENPLRSLPASLGACENLSMAGFKSCEIETVSEASIPQNLRWLILTNNRIAELPASLGQCSQMQKLMLSGNRLETLPQSLANCGKLELLRLASNQFRHLPEWLLDLPSLAWLAISGNPMTSAPVQTKIPVFDWKEIEIGPKIGEGASGFIHQANLNGQQQSPSVAVKIFKGTMTSDGLPANEMAACLAAGQHSNVVGAIGKIANHPESAEGLVMPLIGKEFATLAAPPSFDSCTRDVYPDGFTLDPAIAIRIALGIASAAEHLHSQRMLHGDLYAHNVLWNLKGESLLGDFGAATFYPEPGEAFERIEVRAFGILLEELLTRCEPSDNLDGAWALANQCLSSPARQRPTFARVIAELHACS